MELIHEVVQAQVDSTNSGARAIELVTKTNYQLVIADCGDKDIDGISILERVKAASPTTSVILTAMYASVEEAVKAMRMGAEEYFKKPINPEHFKLAVRRCLDRRALYTGDTSVSALMSLVNACQLVSGFLEEEKILDTVVGYLRRETACKGIALYKIEDGRQVRVETSSDFDADVVDVIVERHNFIRACLEEASPLKIVPRSSTGPEVGVFRFKCVGQKDYCVVCIAPTWHGSSEEVLSRFRLLQAQAQMTGRNIKNYRGVRDLLYIDEPTGLGNTRYLHHCLDLYFERYRKAGGKGTFSVFFIDVDKFKGINDSHGHLVGTKLLHEMGTIIKGLLRRSDVAFRYGGDEFVVLLESAGSSEACQIAERLRTAVEERKFLSQEGLDIRLTVSIGVANCPEHAATKREIIEAADGAMYAVKRASRNKVYIAEKKAA